MYFARNIYQLVLEADFVQKSSAFMAKKFGFYGKIMKSAGRNIHFDPCYRTPHELYISL